MQKVKKYEVNNWFWLNCCCCFLRFQTNIYGFWFVCQLCCVHNRLCLSYIIRTRHTSKKTGFKTQNSRERPRKEAYKNVCAAASADALSVVGSFVFVDSDFIRFHGIRFFYDSEKCSTLNRMRWHKYISRYIISTNEKRKKSEILCLYRNEMNWIINMQHFFLSNAVNLAFAYVGICFCHISCACVFLSFFAFDSFI